METPVDTAPPDSDLGQPLPLGELPLGTHLGDQFAQDGIVFSGQSPYIDYDDSSSTEPTISGTPQFAGDVKGTFVSPTTGQPDVINDFSVVVGYIDTPDSTQMTVLGADGKQLGVLVATHTGFNQLHSTFPGAASFTVSTVANEPQGWELQQVQVGVAHSTYVALGDSYSSGEGTYDFPWSTAQGTTCDTGPSAWPVQFANMENSALDGQQLTINEQSLVACQGEQSSMLTQAVNGESSSEIAQLQDYVADHGPPALVTLTIGGNDIGFAPFLTTCFLDGSQACLNAADALETEVAGQSGGTPVSGQPALIATLTKDYEEVKQAAGFGTPVAVVGYPNLFPAPGTSTRSVTDSCGWLGQGAASRVIVPRLLSTLTTVQSNLNSDMAAAARAAEVQFIPIPTSLQGHEMCTANPWLVPITLYGGAIKDRDLGHPDPAGQVAIASAVATRIDLTDTGIVIAGAAGTAANDRAANADRRAARSTASAPAKLHVTSTKLLGATVGEPYLDYLFAGGGTGADTWTVTSGRLPAGLSLQAQTGTITGTPTAAGTSTITVEATDSSTPTAETATGSLSISVVATPALTVTTGTLPTATTGQPYLSDLQADGNVGPATWEVKSGKLPPGLSLSAATGAILGTPTTAGTTSLTVSATDAAPTPRVATAAVTVTVDASTAPLTVTTTSLPEVQAGSDFDTQLDSTGGVAPTQWSLTGSLPTGLSLDPETGTITGSPTAAGTYDLTARVEDGATPASHSANVALKLVVGAAPALAVTTSQVFAGAVGSYYSSSLQAQGGAGSDDWYVSSGSLPSGVGLDPTTGQITGFPEAAGTFSFDATVDDATGATASGAYTFTVTGPPLQVSGVVPSATVGTYYTGNVQPSGGTGPYSWSELSGTLPTGLTFDNGTGAIVGTPAGAGTFTLQVQVTDSSSPAEATTATVKLTVAAKPGLSLATTVPKATVGTPYTAGVGYVGGIGPYSWTVASGRLPAGLTLDGASGMITGVPTTSGNDAVTVRAEDSSPTPEVATAKLAVAVAVAPSLTVPTQALALPVEGTAYNAQLVAAGGTAPYSWSVTSGSLPAGLSLDGYNGTISGTPAGDVTSSFTVSVTDAASPAATATRSVSLAVQPGPGVAITTAEIGDLTQGSFADDELTSDGGVGPVTYSLAKGSLPAGVSVDPYGDLYGQATKAGFSTFTLQVTDAASPTPSTARSTYTVRVEAAPLAPPGIDDDYPQSTTPLGTAYSYRFEASGNPTPTFTVSSGRLPPGLTLSRAGSLTGKTTTAGTFDFEVTAANGQSPPAVSPQLSIQVVPPPTITGFTPTHGPPGTKVTISGTNLQDASDVSFDGEYADVTSDTTTSIVAVVPVYSSTGQILVETPGGQAVTSARFTVDPSPPPAITSISPLSAPVGATLTIHGSGLLGAEDVEVAGEYSYTYISDTATEIQVAVPSGAGTGPVTVVTPGGTVTSKQTFTTT